ncbi:MAG: leucine-rich repeat domain-containing protein [Clostridia bacterium]|nr:leucine-rich repeat domain-containing protein [Clostridia bacterium]
MKKTKILVLLTLMLSFCLSLSLLTACQEPNIDEITVGVQYKLDKGGKSYFVVGIGTVTDTDIIIDSVYNDMPVTRIGPSAFRDCVDITSIVIPDTVTAIGISTFRGCSGLTSITIPDSVTSIGGYAFSECNNLQSITLPFVGASKDDTENPHFGYVFGAPNYEKNAEYIPESLKEVTITSATSIGEFAFHGCGNIESITISDGVTRIGSRALEGCSGLESLTLPFLGASKDDTENPHFGYIFGAPNYEENAAYIPELLKEVSITSATSIGQHAFYGCNKLESITIPDSATSIRERAFEGCGAEIVWENAPTMANIGEYAFSGYKGTSITIPDSVTSIGHTAFYKSTSLESITLPFIGATKNGTSNTHFGYIFGVSSYSNNDDYVPTSLKTVIITGGNIRSRAFYNCSSLTNITIPDSVTSIGDSAFESCSSLVSITIPDSVTSMGDYAFEGCSSLESITLPFVGETKNGTSNTHFGYIFGAWSYHDNYEFVPTSLKTVIVTGGESIGEKSFYHCYGLISITIPDSVTSIGRSAFEGCSGLTSITIPDSVTSIGYDAFSGCSGLESITLPFVGATKNGTSNTHFGCIFGAGSYSYNENYVPTSLKTVIITGGESIKNSAFYNCSNLTSITIPDTVTSIGDYAFIACYDLERVFYMGTAEDWSEISIGSDNSYLTSATIYYYSESQPTDESNYWHYDADGVTPVIWD